MSVLVFFPTSVVSFITSNGIYNVYDEIGLLKRNQPSTEPQESNDFDVDIHVFKII